MLFGAIGDVHGAFDALDRVLTRHPDVAFWVCPGDLADDRGEYPSPPAPLYWIKGNNENFDFVDRQPAGSGTVANLHYIPNGRFVTVAGMRIAGLGGTFAPTWYETPADRLGAAGTVRDDKRRHFVRGEVEACERLTGIDIFLSHEAPRPFPLPGRRAGHPIDAGKTAVNEVLASMRPRLHLFGHHHRYTVSERQHVASIGLEMVTRSYLIFNGKTLAHQRHET